VNRETKEFIIKSSSHFPHQSKQKQESNGKEYIGFLKIKKGFILIFIDLLKIFQNDSKNSK